MIAFSEYIGLPYKEGGSTTDGFNCWGLLRHIQAYHFGVIIPEIPIHDQNAVSEWFSHGMATHDIEHLDKPTHGACVLLRGGAQPHVGVFLDIDGGGVIHALEEVGVIFTPTQDLKRMGYTRLKFYKYRNERSTCNTQEPLPGSP